MNKQNILLMFTNALALLFQKIPHHIIRPVFNSSCVIGQKQPLCHQQMEVFTLLDCIMSVTWETRGRMMIGWEQNSLSLSHPVVSLMLWSLSIRPCPVCQPAG